jgi:DNA primase
VTALGGRKTPAVRNGDELRGPCPIHKSAKKDKNFTVNIRKNAFKCFSSDCGARGNVLDFVAAMERCSVREAVLKLKERFAIREWARVKRGTGH